MEEYARKLANELRLKVMDGREEFLKAHEKNNIMSLMKNAERRL